MNNLTITSQLYQEDNRIHGYFLVGTVERKNNVETLYESDTSLVSMLKLSSMYQFRKILQDAGATVVANNRTCFPTQDLADAVIPKLTALINENMLY
jgi:hypothetical protein